MRIAKLEIENFRGIKKGCLKFGKHPVFIGSNNVGKTTVIEALALLLGRARMIRDLTEHDFFGSTPQPADRIKLIATITDFTNNSLEDNSVWFRDGRAVPKWLDETTGEIHPSQNNSSWKLCCQIAAQAFFDHTALAVEYIRYFHDYDEVIDPFFEDSPQPVPGQLIRELGFFLIRANRTWDKMLSWGSELFRRTLNTAAAQPFEAILTERDNLRNPARPIDEDPNIKPLIEHVNAEINRCMPDSPTLKLRITNTDSKSVMESVSAHFSTSTDTCVPTSRQGSGLISLQSLLLLLELGRVRSESGEEFVMALEEPELHLPPATQQQIVHRIQALTSQTFITTHSPTIAAMADPLSVLILRNDNGFLTSEPFLMESLRDDSPNWMRKFFQQSRVEVFTALIHSFVLIPEGKTEFHVLKIILRPLMVSAGWTDGLDKAFGLGVGIVPTEDAKVVETYDVLKRMHPQVVCLVDGDGDGQRYATALNARESPPFAIISWNEGAAIEDVIGWILEADAGNIIRPINEQAEECFDNISAIVLRLKEKKMDLVFYELIADIIANNGFCRERAAELINDLNSACFNSTSTLFHRNDSGIWVFTP